MGVSSDTQYMGESLALVMQTVPLVADLAHAGNAVVVASLAHLFIISATGVTFFFLW